MFCAKMAIHYFWLTNRRQLTVFVQYQFFSCYSQPHFILLRKNCKKKKSGNHHENDKRAEKKFQFVTKIVVGRVKYIIRLVFSQQLVPN